MKTIDRAIFKPRVFSLIKRIFLIVSGCLVLVQAVYAEHIEIDHLLQEVQQVLKGENKLHSEREARFKSNVAQQKQLFAEAKVQLNAQRQLSDKLQARFDENEKLLTELQTTLNERQGELGEVFGMVRQVAADLKSDLATSLISAQFPGRAESLQQFASGETVITAQELRQLWFLIQQEMTESGKVSRFKRDVLVGSELTSQAPVTRIGTFNLLDQNGLYLQFLPEDEQVIDYPKQPASGYVGMADDFVNTSEQITDLGVDPTRGGILNMLTKTPDEAERLLQGGVVGYIIIALGLIGLGLVIYRFFALHRIHSRTSWQLEHIGDPSDDNPLGRVLRTAQKERHADTEAMELIVDEAVTKEIPFIERTHAFIKLLAGVAPLLGLFGTVTGMIETFQAISLYGTGDPKLMAGGISQALITTQLGLMVAIPLLFLHSFLTSRSKNIIQVLDEQSAGLLVESLENNRS
ncbi:MAG: MotA/TolQ/ExbB proton channel family protein [Gammaproteobacteria bacterium]|nr:MotA/TolQ/ExbB proton channel family protein [Gammaproteobacteria bacterium]